ncbi:hypothetical protein [Neisseria sicca]|uniref:hypothetical protein n=1 Tax=Neisseria sicca TaxID=490 RepID=UPI0039658693
MKQSFCCFQSFNTQPPEGGWFHSVFLSIRVDKFQHTAARRRLGKRSLVADLQQQFQHTAARRRLVVRLVSPRAVSKFQHTAARRRLAVPLSQCRMMFSVSTHSRPKAAGSFSSLQLKLPTGFNTQPPEGGWVDL